MKNKRLLIIALFITMTTAFFGCTAEETGKKVDVYTYEELRDDDEFDFSEKIKTEKNIATEPNVTEEFEEDAQTAEDYIPVTEYETEAPAEEISEVSDAEPTFPIVYYTNSGSKYHSSGCSYLKKSQNQTTLENAISWGYTPCSKCNPPR